MKKLLFSLACVLAAMNAFAQGTVDFKNVGVGLNSPVFDTDGTTKLTGANFLAQLYVGADASSLNVVAGSTPFLASGGFFTGGVKTLTGFGTGARPFFQVRAWAASGGATYEAAVAASAKAGKSTVFQIPTPGLGGPQPPNPDAAPALLTGLTSFSLVPEPSTIALGILGAAALLIRRRK